MLAPYPYPHRDSLDSGNKDELALLAATDLLSDYRPTTGVLSPTPPSSDLIQYGSHLILYCNRDVVSSIHVQQGMIHDNKYGHFHHDDMIGLPYGSRLYARKPKTGWACLLRPIPDIWSICCPHVTEVLYQSDISMVLYNLDIRSGSIVVECGTGSASLTTALVHGVYPTGRVYSFEYHKVRAERAREQFMMNNLHHWVSCIEMDIVESGFPRDLYGKADAVFLDLPTPHKVVSSSRQCLKYNGRFGSFSPCIEQVQATCEELKKNAFLNIVVLECLQRTYDVRSVCIRDDFECEDNSNVWSTFREEGDAAGTHKAADSDPLGLGSIDGGSMYDKISSNCKFTSIHNRFLPLKSPSTIKPTVTPNGKKQPTSTNPRDYRLFSKPHPEMRGHTGYLVFATNYNTT